MGYTLDASIPFPLRLINAYKAGTDGLYNRAIAILNSIKDERSEAERICNQNIYNTLIAFYEEELSNKRVSMVETRFSSLVRDVATITQLTFEWNKYKQMYRFNKELFHLLTEETDTKSIMSDILLYKLPFPCFYIDNELISKSGNKFVGFFVFLRLDTQNKPRLYIQFSNDDKDFTYSFCSLALNEGKNVVINDELSAQEVFDEYGNLNKKPEAKDDYIDLCKKAISCVAYLCTDKVDVVKKKAEYKTNNTTKKKPKKVNYGLVGDKISRVIKENRTRFVYEKRELAIPTGKSGSPKSPHIRRAHYHSFWVGKRSDPANRKLIVKLVSPMFINGGAKTTTIRKVEKE